MPKNVFLKTAQPQVLNKDFIIGVYTSAMVKVLYDISINISTTWIIALYVIPQTTIFDVKERGWSLIFNIVGASIFLFLSIFLSNL